MGDSFEKELKDRLEEIENMLGNCMFQAWRSNGFSSMEAVILIKELSDIVGEAYDTANDKKSDDVFPCLIQETSKWVDELQHEHGLTESAHEEFLVIATNSSLAMFYYSFGMNGLEARNFGGALKWLCQANYHVGCADGSLYDRAFFGPSVKASKAAGIGHQHNREKAEEIKQWYRDEGSNYKSKDQAAVHAMTIFNLSFRTIRKHITGL